MTKCWIANNVLHLNETKTDVISFGPPSSLTVVGNQLGSLLTNREDCVRNLGVVLDTCLNFTNQISSVVKSSFIHLCSVDRLKQVFSQKDLETVVHTLINSHLDYGQSL